MEFIALLSSGKGTWGQVAGLVSRGEWDKVILVGNSFAKDTIAKFDFAKKAELVIIDFNIGIKASVEELKKKLKGKVDGIEVALSIASGSGKEHMALISALLQVPVGIRFVALTRDGVIEF